MSGDELRVEYRSDIRAIGAFMVDAALSAVPIEEQDDTSTEGVSLVLQAIDGRLVLSSDRQLWHPEYQEQQTEDGESVDKKIDEGGLFVHYILEFRSSE